MLLDMTVQLDWHRILVILPLMTAALSLESRIFMDCRFV